MNLSSHQQFKTIIEEDKCWDCDLLFNESIDANSDPIIVNLSEYFKRNELYTFPVQFNGPEYFEHLVVSLQMASIKSGFIFKKLSMKTKHKLQKSNFEVYLALGCQSCTCYQVTNSSDDRGVKQRKTSTKLRTSKKDMCTFTFYWKLFKKNHTSFPWRWTLTGSEGDCIIHPFVFQINTPIVIWSHNYWMYSTSPF